MSTADAFDWFADWAEGTSPLYAYFSHRIQDDEQLLDVASEVRDDQPPPHLLFAAVHALLLDGAETPLRAYYPSVVDGDASEPDDRSYDLFREFVLAHEEAIREVVASRRTQTNAVRRCAVLYPAFAAIAEETGDRLALLELGPSAGLNLQWDAYRYRYRTDEDDDTRMVGQTDAPVTIDSTILAGAPPLPEAPPTVVDRLGVDLVPLDVTDDADVTWLRALVWPEHTNRHDLLADAIPVVRGDPPEIEQGDAVERLPALVDRLPTDATRVVSNTNVLYQLTDDERGQIEDHVRELGRDQPLYWISGEGAHPDYEESIELTVTRSAGGELEERLVAAYQQHGRWVAWPE